jgi:hypothetical protein
MSQSVGLALATERIPFATAIAPIYAQSVDEFAQNAAHLHEVSGGRFQFGIGIAHAPAHVRMEVKPGKPLGDIRAFVEKFKSHTEYGPLPPVILATLRKRMNAAEAAIAAGRTDELPRYLTDRWLADCTLYGPAARIREGVEEWRDAGITTPVLVPLAPDGNQMSSRRSSPPSSGSRRISASRPLLLVTAFVTRFP